MAGCTSYFVYLGRHSGWTDCTLKAQQVPLVEHGVQDLIGRVSLTPQARQNAETRLLAKAETGLQGAVTERAELQERKQELRGEQKRVLRVLLRRRDHHRLAEARAGQHPSGTPRLCATSSLSSRSRTGTWPHRSWKCWAVSRTLTTVSTMAPKTRNGRSAGPSSTRLRPRPTPRSAEVFTLRS